MDFIRLFNMRKYSQAPFGRWHDARHARVVFQRHAQRAPEGLEYGFGDVVGVAAFQVINMQRYQRMIDEALEEFVEQVGIELADV